MKLFINLTAAIVLVCISVDHAVSDDSTTIVPETNVTDNQTQNGSTQTTGMDWSQVSKIAKSMMCFLSCRGHSFMSPPDCACPGKGCDSMNCDVGKSCKILKDNFAACLKDSSVCDQAKSSVACGQDMMAFYWNKDTMECEKFDMGQCSDNENGFQSKGECLMTCSSEIGKGKLRRFGGMGKGIAFRGRGKGRKNGKRFQGRRPGGRRPGRFGRN